MFKKIFIVFILVVSINVCLNNSIISNNYIIENKKVNDDLNGYRIVSLSDIHSIRDDNKMIKIINKIKKENPNVIFISGDLIDSSYYSKQKSLYKPEKIEQIESKTISFMSELVKICDVYYIYGNHEIVLLDDPINNEFVRSLKELDIKLINNTLTNIQVNNTIINVVGVQDPATLYKDEKYAFEGNNEAKTKAILDNFIIDDNLTLLLAHRSEFFELYSNYKIDIAFTGHNHGGIIRLPIVRGLYSRAEGFMPKYSVGKYSNEKLTMIVNAGIGYSEIPIRVFNPPEIVTITLKKGIK